MSGDDRGANPEAEFADFLRSAGARLKGLPIMDGQPHRVAVEGDKGGDTSGLYRGYLDGRPGGFIRNFRTSQKANWKSGAVLPVLSAAERAARQQWIAAKTAARERDAKSRQTAVARRSAIAWEGSRPAPTDHPYLRRKGVSGDGLRVDQQGLLLVPMRDLAGHLCCLQTIAADGPKLFPKGSRLHGLHLLLGEVRAGEPLLIAEGWATGQTLHTATGLAVAVAFNKPNFVVIALAYRERFPGLSIGFCGDNDHHLPRRNPPLPNGGKVTAEEAARDTGGAVVLPDFEPHQDGTDWNDYAALHGLEAVRNAVLERVQAVSAPAMPAPLQAHYPAPITSRADALAALPREVAGFFQDAARCVEVRRERLKAQEAHPPGSRERRAALRDVQRAMRAKYGTGWRKPGRRLMLPGAAGSGKTAVAAREVEQRMATLGTVFFATDKLTNAEDVARDVPGLAVVRGRSAKDPKDPNGRTMCWRPAAAEAVAHAGLHVGTSLCDDGAGKVCPFKGQCGYQRDMARHRSGTVTAFAGSHEYLTQRGPMPSPDVVVIDESCVRTLVGHLEFGWDRLLDEAMPGWQRAGLTAAMAFRSTMVQVREAVRDPDGILAGLRKRGITEAAHLAPAIAYLRTVEGQDFTSAIAPDLDDGAVLEALERYERSEISSVLKMLTTLQAEIHLPRDHAHGVAFHPDKPVKVDGRTERQHRVTVHYRKRLAFRADVPVLILDASGDAEIYRPLFGGRLEVADGVRCERNVEVVQVRDLTMARTSLTGTDRKGNPRSGTSVAKAARLRTQVVEVVEALAAQHGAFMVATNKPVEALLAPDLGEVAALGHFGALRGSNAYQDCAAGMVLGREQTWPHVPEDTARAIWATDPEPLNLTGAYVEVTRGIRMRDGSAVPVTVDVHPDPRVQRVLELHRERESEQAVDRLRLIHNAEPKTLYVACDLPLDLTVDRDVTWRDFVHEVTGRLDNGRQGKGRRIYGNRLAEAWRLSGGVLPLSRGALLRLFGPEGRIQAGLWGSERAMREDLERGRSRQIESLLAETAPFPPVMVRYRLEGQRGSDCTAMVGLPGDAGRAALAALEGPLGFYEVVNPEPPAAVLPSTAAAAFAAALLDPLPGAPASVPSIPLPVGRAPDRVEAFFWGGAAFGVSSAPPAATPP